MKCSARGVSLWCLVCLGSLALLAGCGSSGNNHVTDAGTDGNGFEPYMPPPAENPYRDVPYLQEFNHTLNEVEPGIGALVAVLIPPDSLTGFETPTQITSRGLVTHQAGVLQVVNIEEGEPDLIAAAFSPSGLVATGPDTVYLFPAGQPPEPHPVPNGTTLLGLAAGAQQVYLLTNQGVGVYSTGQGIEWPSNGERISAAVEHGDSLIVGGDGFVLAYEQPAVGPPGALRWTFGEAEGLTTGKIVGLVSGVSLPVNLDLVVVGQLGIQGINLTAGVPSLVDVEEFQAGRVPLDQPTSAIRAADGGFIVATRGGAYRIMERGIGPEWRTYLAERWLPSGDVRDVATDPDVPDGPIYFATAGGLASVTARRISLEEKLVPFIERVVQRHDRDGAVADSRLGVKGDLSTSVPWDSDNDGGWTCYWILSECFRYLVTGDPAAKAHFDKSLDRMLSFRTLTGTEHFLARAVIRKDGCVLDDCDDPDGGEWFTSPDGEWWVKGDTSNDEVTSHMFMMGHAYDLCADDEQRERIMEHVDGIIGGIVDNGYQLIDIDGEVTSYGQFDPGYVNDSPLGAYADGGRRSVQILAALNLAHYLTGKSKYIEAKQELIEDHHYDTNVITESEYPARKSNDGDELATQAFFILLRYEPDLDLRDKWLEGWRRSYSNTRLQQAAFWDMVNAVVGGDDPSFDYAARWLRLTPVDLIRWDMFNSHRLDLVHAPEFYDNDQDWRMRSDGFIVPYDERRCERWNQSQFGVDGGMGGIIELDGADVLAPYWMGRYYGFIVPDAGD